MAQSISDEERRIAKLCGVSNDAAILRAREIDPSNPLGKPGASIPKLTAAELQFARASGVSPQQIIRARASALDGKPDKPSKPNDDGPSYSEPPNEVEREIMQSMNWSEKDLEKQRRLADKEHISWTEAKHSARARPRFQSAPKGVQFMGVAGLGENPATVHFMC